MMSLFNYPFRSFILISRVCSLLDWCCNEIATTPSSKQEQIEIGFHYMLDIVGACYDSPGKNLDWCQQQPFFFSLTLFVFYI
jgi:hypothetical protein